MDGPAGLARGKAVLPRPPRVSTRRARSSKKVAPDKRARRRAHALSNAPHRRPPAAALQAVPRRYPSGRRRGDHRPLRQSRRDAGPAGARCARVPVGIGQSRAQASLFVGSGGGRLRPRPRIRGREHRPAQQARRNGPARRLLPRVRGLAAGAPGGEVRRGEPRRFPARRRRPAAGLRRGEERPSHARARPGRISRLRHGARRKAHARTCGHGARRARAPAWCFSSR